MKISQRGIDLIKSSEGLKLKAYLCPAGIWTIGYGFTKGVRAGMTITEEQATQRLMNEICTREKELNEILDRNHVVVNQNQFDALMDWCYNFSPYRLEHGGSGHGPTGILSRLMKKDYQGAAKELLRWNKVGGVSSDGLIKRRKEEYDLFVEGL